MNRPSALFLLLSALLTSSARAGAPATQSAAPTTQQRKDQALADLEKPAGQLPILGPHKLDEIIRIRLENDHLSASSPLAALSETHRVLIQGDRGLATIHIRPLSSRGLPNSPNDIQFIRDNFSDPSIVYLRTEVYAHPGGVQIVGVWELTGGNRTVTLLDQAPGIDESGERIEPEVHFYVQDFDAQENISVNLSLKAPDLPALTRAHPSEVNAYLRPLFHELHADSLLAPDPHLLWQVFARDLQPDPQVLTKVNSLLPGLDDPAFAKRQAAAEQLSKLGAPAAVVLSQVDRSKLTPEQLTRIDELLAPYQPLSAPEAAKLAGSTEFLLDCLNADDPAIRRLALNRLNQKLDKTIEFDINAPAPARETALDALRARILSPPATQSATSTH